MKIYAIILMSAACLGFSCCKSERSDAPGLEPGTSLQSLNSVDSCKGANQIKLDSLQKELDHAHIKIANYEDILDNIQSSALNGRSAIENFDSSWELQEALDAFDEIESLATY